MSAQQARGGLETIDIKGKPYVTVAERIKAVTNMDDLDSNRYDIEEWERFELDGKHFLTCHIRVGKSTLTQNDDGSTTKTQPKRYSGTSQISFTGGMVNTTSGYENAETSALGRALAFAGIGLLEGVASADEIVKAEASRRPAEAYSSSTRLVSPKEYSMELEGLKARAKTLIAAKVKASELDDFFEATINKAKPETASDFTAIVVALEAA